jgi:hypothetical protein
MTMDPEAYEAMCARRGLDPERLRRSRENCLARQSRAKALYQERKLFLSSGLPSQVSQAVTANKGNGWVYFAKCQDFVKIGFAVHSVHNRIAVLQNGNPFPMILIGVLQGSISLEKELHKIFLPYHHKGEWYKAHPDVESVYPILRKPKQKVIEEPQRTSILGFLIQENHN